MSLPPTRLRTPEWFTVDASVLNVALVYPMQGPAGIFGPGCEACARLAPWRRSNAAGGVLGRELRLLEVDGGAEPSRVAAEVEALVAAGAVQGVHRMAHQLGAAGGGTAGRAPGAVCVHRAVRGR
ncbi:hypothetical protein SMICM304S_05309 [Streptomyces microflavus]